MQNIILIGHLLLALAIIVIVLLQRTEGGALGIGGGGNEMKTGRKPGHPLVKLTAILGFCFFVTSLGLTLLAQRGSSLVDELDAPAQPLTIPQLPKKNGGE